MYGFVDFKLRVGFEVFPSGCFGIVTWSPRAIRVHFGRQVFNDGVKYYAVAIDRCKWSVGFQFCQYVLVGVVRVETNKDAAIA